MQMVDRSTNSTSSAGSARFSGFSTGSPRVSVCLPNLNNRPFLEERLATIFDQTFSDWELVIFDNYSEDGAWELFQEAASSDSRLRLARAAREGMYANWNNCVRASRGEFVYIATSDDTMADDCLEKLAAALDAHPECDIAHCNLRMFDSNGRESSCQWWLRGSLFAASSGQLVHQRHIRRAPFDGLLHLSGDTVYTSITQLLIRRSLFDRIGMFDNRWGSLGDFHWNMRAGLVANTIHVPCTWGGWRQHAGQATAAARFGSCQHLERIDAMVADALHSVRNCVDPVVYHHLMRCWAPRMHKMRHIDLELRLAPDAVRRRVALSKHLAQGSWFAWWRLCNRLADGPDFSRSQPNLMQTWLRRAGLGEALIPVTAGDAAGGAFPADDVCSEKGAGSAQHDRQSDSNGFQR